MRSEVPTIVLVDDDARVLSALGRCLNRLGFKLMTYTSPNEALEYVKDQCPDLVISDQRMPEMQGSEMFALMKQQWPDLQTILLSAYHDFDAVAEAFNQHVIDRYVSKPWDNKELRFIVSKLLDTERTNKEDITRSHKLEDFHGILSANSAMRGVFDRIRKVATANVPVFITGPTGTGKEMVAQACHMEGFKKSQPFIAVNCANFTEHLMESQLFGHKKGAFTGATSDQEGLFSSAGKGTLFLDEVTTLPLDLQAKLLRVLQQRDYSPLGSQQLLPFDAQLLTASSTTLANAVDQGEFREDLYYRLNVISIDLPALKNRGEDLLLLAEHFLKHCSVLENKSFSSFSEQAIELLQRYHWPGNVRQLENLLHGLIILNDGVEVTLSMLEQALHGDLDRRSSPQKILAGSAVKERRHHHPEDIEPLWQVEKYAIQRAIDMCEGNILKAAALLEISPSTIYRKQKQWQE